MFLGLWKHTGPLTTRLVGIILRYLSFFFLYTNLKVDFCLPFKSRHLSWYERNSRGNSPPGWWACLAPREAKLCPENTCQLWAAEGLSVVWKWGQRPVETEPSKPVPPLSRKRKWLPNRDLAEKFQAKSGLRLLLLHSLKAFLLNSLPFEEDKEPSYVSACNFTLKRTLGPSAEVDSDIWYGHQEAVPGAGQVPGVGAPSAYSTFSEHPYEWRIVYSVFALRKCLLLCL